MTPRQRDEIAGHDGEAIIVRVMRDGQIVVNAQGRLVTSHGTPWYVRVRGNPEDACPKRGPCDCAIRLWPDVKIRLGKAKAPRAETLTIWIGK